MIVIDASVAAKLYLEERGSDIAQGLVRGLQRLVAPDLIRIEVAAAITRRVRLGALPARTARQLCRHWFEALDRGSIALVPAAPDLPRAVELAIELSHPLQDCLYLALAERLDFTLATADVKFAGRVRTIYPDILVVSGEA